MAIDKAVVLSIVCLVVVAAKDASTTCDIPIHHYAQLGCTPVLNTGSSGCPERFECASMLARDDDNKCYSKSKAFNVGEKLVIPERSINCSCEQFDSGKVGFICAAIQLRSIDWSKSCVYQYALGDIEYNKEICDPEEMAALATCNYGNKTYREGERIFPEDSCKICICGKEFDGTLDSLLCLQQTCYIEVIRGNVIKEGCAPVFYGQRTCCPVYWKCPEIRETVTHSNMKCNYGKKFMNIGEEVTTDSGCVKCKCNIPPLVTCTRAEGCHAHEKYIV